MSDFSDYLASLSTSGGGTTFSAGSATPYANGISQNVLSGTVNVGSHTGSVDTELLSHPGGTRGRSLAGTETTPVSVNVQQAAMALYGLRPDEIQSLQDRLVSAGYITAKDISTRGVIDGATAKAYGDLLQDTSAYNAAGNAMTVNDLLAQRSSARTAAGLDSTGRGPHGTQLDVLETQDPATLRAAAHAAFKEATGRGRKVDDKVIDKFVHAFTSQQLAAQRGVNSARNRVEAGNRALEDQAATGAQVADAPMSQEYVTSTPDMGARAAEFARAQAPAEAGAHDLTKQFGTFLSLLKGIV